MFLEKKTQINQRETWSRCTLCWWYWWLLAKESDLCSFTAGLVVNFWIEIYVAIATSFYLDSKISRSYSSVVRARLTNMSEFSVYVRFYFRVVDVRNIFALCCRETSHVIDFFEKRQKKQTKKIRYFFGKNPQFRFIAKRTCQRKHPARLFNRLYNMNLTDALQTGASSHSLLVPS